LLSFDVQPEPDLKCTLMILQQGLELKITYRLPVTAAQASRIVSFTPSQGLSA
jgi:hypothetical protein